MQAKARHSKWPSPGITLHFAFHKSKATTPLAKYLHKTRNYYWNYMYLFFLVNSLFLLIIILQMFLMDWFLVGQFWTLGFKTLKLPFIPQNNSLVTTQIFPRKIECPGSYFGKSGTLGNMLYKKNSLVRLGKAYHCSRSVWKGEV